MARQFFLDPAMYGLVVDWSYWARHVAGHLRVASKEYLDDVLVAGLVSELRLETLDPPAVLGRLQ
ncbi:hypothetical protein OG585_48305 (plasmid) [Streptomyces sp. NBC_01340]|uniref:MmyB family transcriptional regulator n=1 Tax=Streptomyces sp. NBC_01719 TaxID=2975920 RepID=UPI002259DB5A|nr:hypothetical protein [Streptomyces sp. NBC_01719]MCX4461018.1 hypothetical protein [Streptomyces sp. NBC_01719]MCX4499653.1 hypothetical protein [Streptomyces sp. NBC_01728]WSI45893.1 hypothetical protein OG585_48305 [Streptomyces sp. NBC_01340]